MKINEITNSLKTYTARVKLNNGSWVKTSVEAENSSQALLLLKHLYLSVSSVTELTEQENELDEATATKNPQQLQVKALADQAKPSKSISRRSSSLQSKQCRKHKKRCVKRTQFKQSETLENSDFTACDV